MLGTVPVGARVISLDRTLNQRSYKVRLWVGMWRVGVGGDARGLVPFHWGCGVVFLRGGLIECVGLLA